MTPARILDKIRVALHRPRNAMIAIALCLFGALGAGWFVGYVGGVIDGKYKIGSYKQAERVEYKFFGGRFKKEATGAAQVGWADTTKRIETALLNLDVATTTIDAGRAGRGGGLAEFRDDVIVLTHTGDIFIASGPDAVVKSSVETPDNGFSAYVEASQTRFADLTHQVEFMRYNDILHIETKDRHQLIISYTEWIDERDCYRTTLSALDIPQGMTDLRELTASANNWRQIYATEPCLPLKKIQRAMEGLTAGGRLAFRAPSTLILASGDYHWDGFFSEKAIAQDPAYDYGKVISIDVESGDARQISQGHRNTQGVTFDAAGDLWVVEHGHRGGDELNLIVEGKDYGWPRVTLGTRYSGLPIPGVMFYGRHDAFEPPIYAWLPSIAISSLKPIENFDDSWNGDLLLASLQSQSLYRIRLRDRRVEFVEPIFVGQRLRYALPMNDGRIVLWTDNQQLVFLTKGGSDLTTAFIDDYIEGLPKDDEFKNRLRAAVETCQQCHALNADNHAAAPALGGIYGADIASTPFANYSRAILSVEGEWTHEKLIAFTDNPASIAPGTVMPDPGVDDPETQEALVELLAALSRRG